MPFYRKKMFWFSLVLSAIVIGGALVYVHYANRGTDNMIDNSLVFKRADIAVSMLKTSGNRDSNGNGIPDWQEALNGASITTTPTTDDAPVDMSDFTPAIEGPFSQAFERQLFANLASTDSASSIEDVVASNNSIIAEDPRFAPFINPTVYTADDIHTTKSADTANIAAYIANVALTLTAYDQKYPGNISSIISATMSASSTDPAELAPLRKYLDKYTYMRQSFLNMEVPEGMHSVHLNLLNSVSGIVLAISNMQHLSDDPIRGALGMQQYQNFSQIFSSTLTKLSDFASQYQ